MIEVRAKRQLGSANYGWLNTKYHFSFSDYYDPNRINWGQLRVWNNDTIAPKTGFPAHPHNDMEIITYVYKGAITHTDSLGNEGRTVAGDVQVMSAGTGITHSEYNLEDKATELFQIWIVPENKGHKPSWGSKKFPQAERQGQFSILASGYSQDNDVLSINANARVLAISLLAGQSAHYILGDKKAYVVAARGQYKINDHIAQAGDGVAIKEQTNLYFEAIEDSEIVMVEMV